MPFIRGYTAVAAGLLKIPPGIFLPAVLLSALTWSGGYVIAGKLLGHEYANVVQKLGIEKVILVVLVLLCIVGFLGPYVYHWLKKKRIPPSGWSYVKDNRGNDQE
jgi:membrane protein DedA with SNARE-associated domain